MAADDSARQEPDRVDGVPHPREAVALHGQERAETAFLEAWRIGRLHHAWMLTGSRGVGKATLAYRMARRRIAERDERGLLGSPEPPSTLEMDQGDPVAHRVAAGSEPLLHVLRRGHDEKTGKLRTVIRVDDVRALKSFFQLSAADGGWRVAIVDPAEEMNGAAANALLKLLEEPPARSMLILISHAPARLLPTIRSRCRTLKLDALSPADLAVALHDAGVETPADMVPLTALSGGSVGEAARLIALNGPALYERMTRAVASAPGMPRSEMIAIADACAGREAEPVYDLTLRLTDFLLARLARAGALGAPGDPAAPSETAMLTRLSQDEAAARIWADLSGAIQAKASRARAVNLDPAQVMLDIFLDIDDAARKTRARAA